MEETKLVIDASRVSAEGETIEGEVDCVNLDEELAGSFGALRYRLEVQFFGAELLVRGNLEQDFSLVCSRCGKDFDDTVKVDDFTASYEVAENAPEIDITNDVREAILLKLDLYPLCSEDCVGLETHTQLPPDERWGALDNLKTK